MSDVQCCEFETIYLLPREIKTCARFNVRPFANEANETEDALVEQLALTIEAEGQLDSVIITPDYTLIAGHRRRAAFCLINERHTARAQSLLKIRCSVDRTGGDLRRKAILSNTQRKESSPMDLAYLIAQTRNENSWEGWQGTKKVAEYLAIDPTTVYQIEKLLAVEKELQNRIHNGTLSVQSVLDLIKQVTKPAERAAMVQRASEIQSEEKLERILDAHRNGKKKNGQATKEIASLAQPQRIERPAILAAIRERQPERHTVQPRKILLTRPELLESLAQFDSSAYPQEARDFARYFVGVWAKGEGTPEELRAKFEAAVQPLIPPDEFSIPHEMVMAGRGR